VLAGGPAVADEVLYVLGEILEINLVFCMAFINIITCQVNALRLEDRAWLMKMEADIVTGGFGIICIEMGDDFK
jgi:hypothetical protein